MKNPKPIEPPLGRSIFVGTICLLGYLGAAAVILGGGYLLRIWSEFVAAGVTP